MSRPPVPRPEGRKGGAAGHDLPRLAFTAMEAPAVLGVSDDFFRRHVTHELRWVRRGSKKLVSLRELEAWLEKSAEKTLP